MAEAPVVIDERSLGVAQKKAERWVRQHEAPSQLKDVVGAYLAISDAGFDEQRSLRAACGLYREQVSFPSVKVDRWDSLIQLAHRLGPSEAIAAAYHTLSQNDDEFTVNVAGSIYRARILADERPVVIGQDAALSQLEQCIGQLMLYDPATGSNEDLDAMHQAVLLQGPPGTGKGVLTRSSIAYARELSSYCKTPVRVDWFDPSSFSKWVGESSKQLKEKFDRCRDPSGVGILVLDEVDMLVQSRQDSSSSHGFLQVTGQLMQELSGVFNDNCGNLLVIAATNQTGALDPGLLDRFRLRIPVPLYDSLSQYVQFTSEKMSWASDGLQQDVASRAYSAQMSPRSLEGFILSLDRSRRPIIDKELFKLPVEQRNSVYRESFADLTSTDVDRVWSSYVEAGRGVSLRQVS